MRRNHTIVALVAMLSVFTAGHEAVSAQSYPATAVRVLNGFPPGGATEVIGRIVYDHLTQAPFAQAMMQRELDWAFDVPTTAQTLSNGGHARLLAITAAERDARFPADRRALGQGRARSQYRRPIARVSGRRRRASSFP